MSSPTERTETYDTWSEAEQALEHGADTGHLMTVELVYEDLANRYRVTWCHDGRDPRLPR